MSMFAWMFDRQQEIAQLKEQVEGLRSKAYQAAVEREELAARMRSIARIASHGLGERIGWLEGQPDKVVNR